MNPYKKLMAVLLCIVLCVSLLPASAFAEAGLAEEPVTEGIMGNPVNTGRFPENQMGMGEKIE